MQFNNTLAAYQEIARCTLQAVNNSQKISVVGRVINTIFITHLILKPYTYILFPLHNYDAFEQGVLSSLFMI